MKHEESVRVRINGRLKKEIAVAAARHGETVSAYIRQTVMAHTDARDPTMEKEVLRELAAIRTMLARIGNNCNQIAKKVNSGETAEIASLDEMLTLIQKAHTRISDGLRDRTAAR